MMKKTLIILYILLIGLYSGTAQEKEEITEGIAFKHVGFSEAVALAEKENKNVFIDFYTVWCGPCKLLAKNIFPQKAVGNFYNKHFINIKIDAEKGEGPELAKKFGVSSYPSLIFVNKNGEMFYKSTGAKNAEAFIGMAKMALDPQSQLTHIRKKYEKSEKTLDDLLELAEKISSNGNWSEAVKTVESYFTTMSDTDRLSEKGWIAISGYFSGYQSELFMYILKNKEEFSKIAGEAKVNNLIHRTLSDVRTTLYIEGEGKRGESRGREITPAKKKKLDEYILWLNTVKDYTDTEFYANKMNYFCYMGTPEHYKYAQKFLETEYSYYPDKDKMAYFCAWMANSYKVEKGVKYKSAVKWAKKGIELSPEQYHPFIVYAHLMATKGNKKEALKYYILAKELKQKGKAEAIIITKRFEGDKIDELIKSLN